MSDLPSSALENAVRSLSPRQRILYGAAAGEDALADYVAEEMRKDSRAFG